MTRVPDRHFASAPRRRRRRRHRSAVVDLCKIYVLRACDELKCFPCYSSLLRCGPAGRPLRLKNFGAHEDYLQMRNEGVLFSVLRRSAEQRLGATRFQAHAASFDVDFDVHGWCNCGVCDCGSLLAIEWHC